MNDLAGAGLAALGAGVVGDCVLGVSSPWRRILPYLAALVGCGLLLVLGIVMVSSPTEVVLLGHLFGVGTTSLVFDHLAGGFLILIFGLGVAVSAVSVSWAYPEGRVPRRGLSSGYLLLLGAAAVVVVAGDAFTFLFAWEALTLSFYILAGISRTDGAQARAAYGTLGIGKIGGACLLIGFLLLAGESHSFTIASWSTLPASSLHEVAYALILAGFAAKVGLVPFQGWIPLGYPAAPGPARAAMAGVAVNAGFYGLWRFLGILGRPPVWLAIVVLALGGVTALLGVAFAAVQGRLSRVVAYSSVENAGIILTAYGLALAGAATGETTLVALGLLAASLQVVAHAIGKTTLFVSLAAIEAHFGTDELDELRGIGRSLPFASMTFAIGAITLAGLPPTIGFVSEWFVLESLMQQFRVHGIALPLAIAFAGGLVALTAGLALLTFLRVLGLTILGPPRAHRGDAARLGRARGGIVALPGRLAMGGLVIGCLGFAAVTPLEIRLLGRSLGPLVPARITDQALRSPWVVQPVYAGFSILSPSWLWICFAVGIAVVGSAAALLSRGRYLRPRRVPAWHSGSPGVSGPASYTPLGFANPLRHVLANVLGTRREVEVRPVAAAVTSRLDPGGAGLDARDGGDRDSDDWLESGVPVVSHHHAEHRTYVVEPVETYLYRPLRRGLLLASRTAKRLQSGRLDAYVAYMLVALLVLLGVTALFHH
jgi:hydrogenase-4 component B